MEKCRSPTMEDNAEDASLIRSRAIKRQTLDGTPDSVKGSDAGPSKRSAGAAESSSWEDVDEKSPDVLRDRDVSDHTIVHPDFAQLLDLDESDELKDTPAIAKGKTKYFRRRALPALRKKVTSPPNEEKASETTLSAFESMIACSFRRDNSPFSPDFTHGNEPLRLISTPTDMHKALAEYNKGPDVSMIEASFISGHNELTDSSGMENYSDSCVGQSAADKAVQTTFRLCCCCDSLTSGRPINCINGVLMGQDSEKTSASDIFSKNIPVHQARLRFVVNSSRLDLNFFK